MKSLSEYILESRMIPIYVFKRLVQGKCNINDFMSQTGIKVDEASEIMRICKHNVSLFTKDDMFENPDSKIVKLKLKKYGDQLFKLGVQGPKTLKKIDTDLNHPPKDNWMKSANASVSKEIPPMDNDMRRMEYDILKTVATGVNKEYSDVYCALFFNEFDENSGETDYFLIVAFGDDEKLLEIFKKINI